MHSLARFWIDRNKAIRRQYSPRFYKEILNEWGLFLMQFFAPIFIELADMCASRAVLSSSAWEIPATGWHYNYKIGTVTLHRNLNSNIYSIFFKGHFIKNGRIK